MNNPGTRVRVVAVIPTYQGERFMTPLLQSLQQQTEPPDAIIVVDNNSTDTTRDLVMATCPQANVIPLAKNRGFGIACNLGIERALQSGADYVLLVNQDLIIEPTACAELVRLMGNEPGFGWMGALQMSYDGQYLDRLFRQNLGDEFYADLYFGRLRELYEVPFAPAAFIIVRREVLLQVGGFDPLFFLYSEDNDLCQRIVKAGWKIGIASRAVVRHWHGLSRIPRTLRWLCRLEYSQALLYVKSSPRSVLLGLLSYLWYYPPLLELASMASKLYAAAQLIANARRVARHRRQNPWEFAPEK